MKITYLYHSGFAVELDRHVLVFDYYKGKLPVWEKDKTILFFASHKHPDHFDFRIFDCFGQYEKTRYFLGSDIRLNESYLARKGVDAAVISAMTRLNKHTEITWEDVTVETLRSTDEGVAFLVSVEGKQIYHAGDLNWWHWEGEDPGWNAGMEKAYKAEIARIAGRHFDVAFVPLDPRLGSSYGLGMEVFLEQTDTEVVFPMHMWDDYGVISRFRAEHKTGRTYAGRIMEITEPGQVFVL